ncbi:hypothetical protein AOLI_G00202040 [Acnodon oligacanthus]
MNSTEDGKREQSEWTTLGTTESQIQGLPSGASGATVAYRQVMSQPSGQGRALDVKPTGREHAHIYRRKLSYRC